MIDFIAWFASWRNWMWFCIKSLWWAEFRTCSIGHRFISFTCQTKNQLAQGYHTGYLSCPGDISVMNPHVLTKTRSTHILSKFSLGIQQVLMKIYHINITFQKRFKTNFEYVHENTKHIAFYMILLQNYPLFIVFDLPCRKHHCSPGFSKDKLLIVMLLKLTSWFEQTSHTDQFGLAL